MILRSRLHKLAGQRTAAFLGWLLLTATVSVTVVALTLQVPQAPGRGPDGPWVLALSEAHILGMHFSHDFAFTYGPLGFITAGANLHATFWPIMFGRSAISVVLAAAIVWRASECRTGAQRIVFVLGCLLSAAVLVAGYNTILANALLVTIFLLALTSERWEDERRSVVFGIVLGAFAGAAGLTKFTVLVDCTAIAMAFYVIKALRVGAFRGPYWHALLALTGFFIAACISMSVWLAAWDLGTVTAAALAITGLLSACAGGYMGLKPGGLTKSASLFRCAIPLVVSILIASYLASSTSARAYVANSLSIASGYSWAMSIDGPAWNFQAALMDIVVIGVAFVPMLRWGGLERVAALVVFLWVSFKEGFVRQDGHVLAFFAAAILAATLIIGWRPARPRHIVLGALALGVTLLFMSLTQQSIYGSSRTMAALEPAALVNQLNALAVAISAGPPAKGPMPAELAGDRLPRGVAREVGRSAVYVGPTEVQIPYANGLTWWPMPVIQSYSAYTPSLDALDRAALANAGPPYALMNYIGVHMDGRYVAWDEPSTFRELLCTYNPDRRLPSGIFATASGDPYLFLDRGRARCGQPRVIAHAVVSWSKPISFDPPHDHLVFAYANIRPSVFGRLGALFFRGPPVFATVGAVGAVHTYRVVFANAANGILISPLPATFDRFRQLFAGTLKASAGTLAFQVRPGDARFFAGTIDVTLVAVPFR